MKVGDRVRVVNRNSITFNLEGEVKGLQSGVPRMPIDVFLDEDKARVLTRQILTPYGSEELEVLK